MMILHAPSPSDTDDLPIVVTGAANGHDAARRAIEAAGGTLAALFDWEDAASALDHPGCVLLIETEGAADDILAAVLPRLDAAAAALDVPVIVALEDRSIDVVAASMSTAAVQLLCAPSIADRVVALAIAAERRGVMLVSDTVREGEAARLHRLNEEVARIAEVLSRLTRRGPEERGGGAIVSDHPSPFRQQDATPDIVIEASEVRRAIRGRRLRDQHFGGGLFEDPAWDMMLDLFAAELERAQVSVSSLCIAAAVAPTTALRWIAKLTEAGLLDRTPDPFDRRRAFMELSPRASRAMREHVGALRRAGLPFG